MSDELHFLSRRAVARQAEPAGFSWPRRRARRHRHFRRLPAGQRRTRRGAVKGGMLKAGLQGGAATNSLDPALCTSQVPVSLRPPMGRNARRALARRAGQDGARGRVRRIRRRQGLDAQDPRRASSSMTARDDRRATSSPRSSATRTRSRNPARSASWAASTSVKANGNEVVFTLKEPNADLPYLLDDYHLIDPAERRQGQSDAGIGTGPYKVTVNEPGVRHGRREVSPTTGATTAALPIRSKSSSSTMRRRAWRRCRAARST